MTRSVLGEPAFEVVVAEPQPQPWRQQPQEPLESFQAFCCWCLVQPEVELTGGLLQAADRWRWRQRRQQLDQRLSDRVAPAIAMREVVQDATFALCASWRAIAAHCAQGGTMNVREATALLSSLLAPAAAAMAAANAEGAPDAPEDLLDVQAMTPEDVVTYAELMGKYMRRRDG